MTNAMNFTKVCKTLELAGLRTQGSNALALVRRPQLHAQDEVRLKTAAAMAASGDVRDVAEKLLNADVKKEDDPLQKV